MAACIFQQYFLLPNLTVEKNIKMGADLSGRYQYELLKLMVTVVFKDIAGVPKYYFDFKMCIITLAAYLLIYEAAMKIYGKHLSKMPVKEIMLE